MRTPPRSARCAFDRRGGSDHSAGRWSRHAGGVTDFDVAAVRAQFPSLRSGTAHFDGPGGTQVPRVVAHAVAQTLGSPVSNRGTVTASERAADAIVVAARQAMADLL